MKRTLLILSMLAAPLLFAAGLHLNDISFAGVVAGASGVAPGGGGGGITVVSTNSGTSSSATTAATFSPAATAGNLLLIFVNADDYNSTPPTGFTESAGCGQEAYHGQYLWWKIAAGGESSVNYTIGSATVSVWQSLEVSGLSASTPYDTSAGQIENASASEYGTPSITPSSGERFLVAVMGCNDGDSNTTGFMSWTNSFTEITTNATPSGTARQSMGTAFRIVTANGSTAYATGATISSLTDSHSGIIAAFK